MITMREFLKEKSPKRRKNRSDWVQVCANRDPVNHMLILLFILMPNMVSNLIQEPKLEVADEILVSDFV